MGDNSAVETVLGKALQKARKASGLTQQQLCQKAGISYSTLAKIERGAIKAPSIFTIYEIASVLGVTIDELMNGVAASPARALAKKVSKNGVRFVFFDINGCLVRFFHRAFTQIAQSSGKQADVVETAFWHYNDAVCRGDMALEEFNEAMARQLEMDSFDWRKYYIENVEPIAPMHEILAWVSENYYIGLLSNIMPGQIKQLIEKGFVPALNYDVIVDSSEVGLIKPEPEIFQFAEAKTNCKPHEILLVDDSRSNIMAAERLGWKVLWFDDYNPEESVEKIKQALEPA